MEAMRTHLIDAIVSGAISGDQEACRNELHAAFEDRLEPAVEEELISEVLGEIEFIAEECADADAIMMGEGPE